MAEYLVIRLPEHPGDAASWIAVDSSGTRISAPATGPLELAAQSAGDRDVIALVPAAGVLTMSVDIPIKRGPRLLAALPFALEEQLADGRVQQCLALLQSRFEAQRGLVADARVEV